MAKEAKYKAVIAYLFFGGCTTVVNIVVYYLSYNICGISNVISTSIAWFAAVIFAFVTNKLWVFESRGKGLRGNLIELLSFFGCRVATGVMDVAIMWFAVDYMAWNSLLCKIISNIIVIILNYVASKWFIKKRMHTVRGRGTNK